MNALFVLRTSPDIDHMTPVMWKLLDEGQTVRAFVPADYDAEGDYRLRFLCGHERFVLHRAPVWQGRSASYLHDNVLTAAAFLLRRRIDLVVVEWGQGPPEDLERPFTHRWARSLIGLLWGYLRGRTVPNPFLTRYDFVSAARLLGRATACLPHGLNVKRDAATTTTAAAALSKGALPWGDRNRFDVYVLNTEEHRQWHLEYALGDPDVMQTWGSARWSPAWFERNRALAPPFEWPAEGRDRLKVVFDVPKWEKRVHAEPVLELVAALQSLDFVSLAIKPHPRPEDGSAELLRSDPRIDWNRLHDVSAVDSVALIAAADVVLDIGSSIGVEVVMQGKVLVNPRYLHELTTFFDEVQGSCVVAASEDEVLAYLRAHSEGRPHLVPEEAYHELLRRAVYASEPAPFDVLDRYWRGLSGLTSESVSARRRGSQARRRPVVSRATREAPPRS